MTERVVITGTGAIAPCGTTPADVWCAALEGRSGIRALPQLAGLEVTTGGACSVEGPERDVAIAVRAIDDALAAAGRDAASAGLVWGTALDTYARVDDELVHRPAGAAFAQLAQRFGGPRRMIAQACATGTVAIGEAFRLVRSGAVEACVAGGSSTMLDRFYVVGFHALRALAVDVPDDAPEAACKPFDRRRRGFALADGAGALVVESLAAARRRGATPLAEVVGYGASQDAYDLSRPPADGAGASLAMRRALDDAGLRPDDIGAINAHGTGTLVGDAAEAAAIRATLDWQRTPVSSQKGVLGHTQAAAGALEAIIAIETCRTGRVPPTTNLEVIDPECELDHVIGAPRDAAVQRVISVSFGMGGQNAAIVLARLP